MGERWIAEAQDLRARGSSGQMLRNHRGVGVGWHVTVSPSGRTSRGNTYFEAMHKVLTDKAAEPHVLWDPLTDEMGQYFPLDRSARAFGNGPIKTNRDGTIRIQIEVVAHPVPAFTDYWKPGPNFAALMRAIHSWGIPDEWPSGPLARWGGDSRASRSIELWRRSGHHAHCNAPGNDHWDTGPIDQAALLAVGRHIAPPDTRTDLERFLDDMDKTELRQIIRDEAEGAVERKAGPAVWGHRLTSAWDGTVHEASTFLVLTSSRLIEARNIVGKLFRQAFGRAWSKDQDA